MKTNRLFAVATALACSMAGSSLGAPTPTPVDLSKYNKLPLMQLQAQVHASAAAYQRKDPAAAISLLAPAIPRVPADSPAGQLELGWRLLLVAQYLLDGNDSVTAKSVATSALSFLVGPTLTLAETSVHAQGLELAGQVSELVLKDTAGAASYYRSAIALDSHRAIAVAGLARITAKPVP